MTTAGVTDRHLEERGVQDRPGIPSLEDVLSIGLVARSVRR